MTLKTGPYTGAHFEACTQDWFAVASVLESVVSEIADMEPAVEELFLRSDNAGCYHNAALLSSATAIVSCKGLVLKNYSFSEANSGKDVCDRKIAPLKAHVERYLNEGKTASLIGTSLIPWRIASREQRPNKTMLCGKIFTHV